MNTPQRSSWMPVLKFQVRYYDARKSRKGQGVQVMQFATREAAEDFASKNKLYAKPCRVEEI